MDSDQQIDVYVVCNAQYHDTNFAKLELSKLLGENENINSEVADRFRDVEATANSKLLLTYTCDLRPPLRAGRAVRLSLNNNRRFAPHPTNALLDFVAGRAVTRNLAPKFMALLGSRFIAHPANHRIRIRITDVKHPLTFAIEDFEVEDDEPYYCEPLGEQLMLLEASITNLQWDMFIQMTIPLGRVTRKYINEIGIRIHASPLLRTLRGQT